MRLYRDRILKATTATTTIRNMQSVKVGYDNFGALQRWDGQILWFGWWKGRVLSQQDVTWITAEPYAMLLAQSPSVKYFLPAAGGAADYPYRPVQTEPIQRAFRKMAMS